MTTPQTQQIAQNVKDLADIRMSALFEVLTAQRNNALNEVANTSAENAVLKSAMQQQLLRIADLESQLAGQTAQKPAQN